ncbi:MAG: MerR family transcriptional regulator [Pseudomonadota bacterium]|jgi:DNA-binding transcriptional MerR regulator
MHEKLFHTREVLKRVGVSRNTLFLWFKHRKIPEVQRDRNGHRIFTKKDIQKILLYKNRLMPPPEG